MAAQKRKKEIVEIIFIFDCLLTRNPTNQDSQLSWFFQTIWKTVYLKYMSNKDDIWQGKTLPAVLLEERKLTFQNNKKEVHKHKNAKIYCCMLH